jgi:flagellar hook-associated protein 1 FlgK
MSLGGVLANASAALSTAQYQVALSTTNVANASTTGYTSKTWAATSQTATLALNTGTVSRATSTYLLKSVITSAAQAGYDNAVDDTLSRYDTLLGGTDNGSDIASLTSALSTALTSLASGSSTASAADVVSAASDLADGLRDLSSGIQSLRKDADSAIATTVGQINALLTTISGLNSQIVSGQGDAASLADARDTAMTSLASLIGVTSYEDTSGRLNVYTTSGQQLVGDTASVLGFSTSSVSASTTWPDSLAGVTINGRDATSSLTTGELGGLLALRDTILPTEQAALDTLATGVIDAVNTAAASSASYPPSSLTSSLSVASSDALSLTGSLTIVQMTTSGTSTGSTTLDLSGVTTVADLMTALNGVSGVTASLSDGKLTISSTSGGIALDSSAALTASGQTLNAYLGFNDVFTGTDASTIRVSAGLLSDASKLASSTLNASAAVNASAVASGGTGGVQAMLTALGADRALPASGKLSAQTTSLLSYASTVLASAASTVSKASAAASLSTTLAQGYANSLSNVTGVNLDEQTALVSLYQQQYEITAQLMSAIKDMFDTLVSMAAS